MRHAVEGGDARTTHRRPSRFRGRLPTGGSASSRIRQTGSPSVEVASRPSFSAPSRAAHLAAARITAHGASIPLLDAAHDQRPRPPRVLLLFRAPPRALLHPRVGAVRRVRSRRAYRGRTLARPGARIRAAAGQRRGHICGHGARRVAPARRDPTDETLSSGRPCGGHAGPRATIGYGGEGPPRGSSTAVRRSPGIR